MLSYPLDAKLKPNGNVIQMQKTLLKSPIGSNSKNKQKRSNRNWQNFFYKEAKKLYVLRFNKDY